MTPTSGIVFDIKRFAIHDGPGIRTTVFFKGCPLHCWWCHNPESQSYHPELMIRANRCIGCGVCEEVCLHKAIHYDGTRFVTDREICQVSGACAANCYAGAREISGQEMSVAQVMGMIERDIPFYDQSGGGVTFSGGEPLSQAAFLAELLRACQSRDIHTTLDTSGYAPWETLDRVREHIDLFLYDLKIMDDEAHQKYTGGSNQVIMSNLRALSERGHHLVVRVPVIPGINNSQENLEASGAFLASLPNLEAIHLSGYHDIGIAKYESLGLVYQLPEQRPPTPEELTHAAEVLRGYNLPVDHP
jgi:pyruvate formate lyase activating enzyme